jgi:hypothetical protein
VRSTTCTDAYGRKKGVATGIACSRWLKEPSRIIAGEGRNDVPPRLGPAPSRGASSETLIRARTVFRRLSHIEPQHPMLLMSGADQ